MKTLCVVPCGAKKIWDKYPDAGPTPAKDVYIGPFAKKCKEYAVKFYPNSWVILSAKYGFLLPDDIVPGPYNVSFNDPESGPITLLVLAALGLNKNMFDYDKVVVLGGKNYVEMCRELFKEKEISAPLKDCKGIGYMMGKLNGAIIEGKELEG
jgi:hypothetical protein